MNTSSNQPLRAAMIGGGINSAVGRVHDIAMRMDHQFDLVAGCFSRNTQINEASAAAYNVNTNRTYDNLESFLETEKPSSLDVVVIALPTELHANAISALLDHNFTVITDKPTVSTVEEANSLLERLGPDTNRLFTLYNYTGYPIVRQMRKIIMDGQLGTVHRLMIEMPQDAFLRLKNQSSTDSIQKWRLKDGEICGVSLDLFTHIHSLAKFLVQARPQNAMARMRSISQASKGLIDDVDALVEYDNGTLLNAWYGKAALGSRNGLRIRVFGSEGSMEWVQMDPERLLWSDRTGELHIKDRLSPESDIAGTRALNRFKAGHPAGFIEAFANCYYDIAATICHKNVEKANLPSLDDATEGIKLARTLEISHKEGRKLFIQE